MHANADVTVERIHGRTLELVMRVTYEFFTDTPREVDFDHRAGYFTRITFYDRDGISPPHVLVVPPTC